MSANHVNEFAVKVAAPSNSHFGVEAVIPAWTAGIQCHGRYRVGCVSV